MKTLLLLRHAKSAWDDPSLVDFDRPLASRGRKAAPRMGRFLSRQPGVPDLVLCSSAVRAQQTWALVAAELGSPPPVKHLRSLYLAAPSRLLAAIQRVEKTVDRLLLVGHNPGLEHLAARLAGGGKKAGLVAMATKYPTGALAEIRFDTGSWADIAAGAGTLVRFTRPKDLG